MNSEIEKKASDDDEISLIDLFAVLWRRKIMIITITLIAAVGVVIYSVISLALPTEESYLPNVYTPKAWMLINNSSSGGGGLSSILGSMGGLASLAGVSMPVSSSFSELALFLIQSNSLLDAIVDNFNLIEKYGLIESKSPRAVSRKILKSTLKAEFDNASGVLSISFTDIDPYFARDIVNYCTAYLEKRFIELGLDKNKIEKENLELNINNTFQEIILLEEESRKLEQSVVSSSVYGRLPAITTDINRIALELEAQKEVYTQLKVQYELLKVDMASEKPVLQILEMAEAPDKKSKPNRGLLCVIVTFAAGFLAVCLSFAMNAIDNIKNDPEAMAKFKGDRRQ